MKRLLLAALSILFMCGCGESIAVQKQKAAKLERALYMRAEEISFQNSRKQNEFVMQEILAQGTEKKQKIATEMELWKKTHPTDIHEIADQLKAEHKEWQSFSREIRETDLNGYALARKKGEMILPPPEEELLQE